MSKKLFILIFLTATLFAFSRDFIDDVYYWDDPNTTPVTIETNYTAVSPASEQSHVQVTFIEDSITLHSDTIVKAVIRR